MKKLIRKLLNQFGIDVHRFQPSTSFEAQIVNAMKKVKIDVLFDIGANTGEFSSAIREKGYSGKIVSFEPLTSAIKKLIQLASKDVNWLVHDRTAIGDRKGLVDINISKNSYSSSILPMLNLHLNSEFNSRYIGTEKTPIITLDSVADKYLNKSSNCFIKIDTQGYEERVLKGCKKMLSKNCISAVEVEIVFSDIYAKINNISDLEKFLVPNNFRLAGIRLNNNNIFTGSIFFADLLYLNKSSFKI